MITRKIYVFIINFAALSVLMPFSSSAAEKIKTVDGFEYTSVEQLKAKWTIAATGFSGPIDIRLNTKDAKEGRQCLELILPPTKADGIARLTLDVSPAVAAKDIAQIRFWLLVDHPENAGPSGLYWADKEWKNYFTNYGFRKNQSDWQKVYASQSDFKKEAGNPSWNTVSQMRISLWFRGNQPANRILIDEVVWDSVDEKALNLNRDWWE
jgi:hypothetical protein